MKYIVIAIAAALISTLTNYMLSALISAGVIQVALFIGACYVLNKKYGRKLAAAFAKTK